MSSQNSSGTSAPISCFEMWSLIAFGSKEKQEKRIRNRCSAAAPFSGRRSTRRLHTPRRSTRRLHTPRHGTLEIGLTAP
ncbi:hypothetical protein L484_003127 [Morus notabilis]|uniref:Uncharacterized protein n=1 Tax=Morus notabilis TaxID=981085 RepID=W9QHZ6_9ROSA|nr:hypothetical protein L484_003127 [Morus notabilis]